jgi:hypothetical protein
VSVDFTERRLATRNDPRNPWTGSHGSPDFARDTAWQKISNRVEGTRLAAEKLGIG